MSLWQRRHFMNQIGQTNYEIGGMFKPLLSISMMRCRFLMCQHILRTPGNSCIYSLFRLYEITFRLYEILFRLYEITFRLYEILFRLYEILFRLY